MQKDEDSYFNNADVGSQESSGIASARLDPEEFREDLSGLELTVEQENELLKILWEIMQTFVNIGWAVESVQMFLPELFEKVGSDSDKLIDSKHATTQNSLAVQEARKKDSQ